MSDELVTKENDEVRWTKFMSQWRYEGKPRLLVLKRASYRVHIDAETQLPVFTREITDQYASRSV